ncbi:cytochrome oxidase putative small subunit CydP [Hydrogenophaga sp.]|uniref:cytochrome oxidase putative small subunit CydP n=1 Tax=Hydrogenophaga sp. TaxID=1904254 RepID=UPI0035AF4901
MSHRTPRLRRHLGWIIALKLIALTLLWWCFVRDARVGVSPADMARQLAPNPVVQGAPHGQ